MKKKKWLIAVVLLVFYCLCAMVACNNRTTVNDNNVSSTVITAKVPSLKHRYITQNGNIVTSVKAKDIMQNGNISWGDIVSVSFLDQVIEVPVVPAYASVEAYTTALVLNQKPGGQCSGYAQLAINMGNFAETYGIAVRTVKENQTREWTACEGVAFPIEFSFELVEKGGFCKKNFSFELIRTNSREDYLNLTDEQFANFRKVTTKGMNNLYRSSNPVNSELKRNKYADNAFENAHITVVLNLADSKDIAQSRPEFNNSYYKTCNVKYLNLTVDFFSEYFKHGLAEGLRFMSENKGVYAIHCTEGKDRAGFVCALLECLMGASAQEVAEDYMMSYFNYYGIENGTYEYERILSDNLIKVLSTVFNITDFYSADLQKCAEQYLHFIGLSDDEISNLKQNL